MKGTHMERYELVEGSSSKFWQILVEGETLTVTFGRIGTAGQTKTKTFPGSAEAEADMRAELPGIEIAEAKFDNGSVFMGYIPATSCGVHILGRDKVATRDSLIRSMLDMGVKSETSVDSDGVETRSFPFAGHPIYGFSTPEGNIMVQVR